MSTRLQAIKKVRENRMDTKCLCRINGEGCNCFNECECKNCIMKDKNMENKENAEVGLQDKKPSIKLAQARRTFPGETAPMYIVQSMVDTIRFEIGQRLSKAQVQELLDDGTVKVTVNAEK